MSAGSTIRKILFISFWVLVGGGMFSLLFAAISSRNKGVIRDYKINFRGDDKSNFINAKDVEVLLLKAANGKIKGYPVSSLNLQLAEKALEENSWIDEAQLYFDSGNTLHITVSEKHPVARVFGLNNKSFFIDSLGRKIPVSNQATAKLPVFTGYVGKKPGVEDSMLLAGIRTVANYISTDEFWSAQVAQIDITGDKQFEMIPVVGNHMVRLGDAQDIDRKFKRLFNFYEQVLSKTSFDRYKIIDVRFKGQVVACKSEGNFKIDSIQLRRNVEKLLKQSIEAEKDTVIKVLPLIILEKDSTISDDPALIDQEQIVPKATTVPAPKKNTVKEKETTVQVKNKTVTRKVETKSENRSDEKKEPKAVMPKRLIDTPEQQ
jgi:cell division protein FtsQ